MILQSRGITVNVRIWNDHLEQTIVMLHGFTGTVATWDKIAASFTNYRVVAVDLMGHGQTDSPDDIKVYSMEEQLQLLDDIFQQLNLRHFILLGYSMGGRVALSYANMFPNRILHLLLESASPGLKTAEERAERRLSDENLANMIEQNGIESFVKKWENIPLFATQRRLSIDVQQAIREERLSQCEIGLANSLRGMGTGAQKSLWPNLEKLQMSITLITGELDEKFCKIAKEMQWLLLNAQHVIVEDVGHAIHVENPETFATIVKDAIKIKRS